MRSRSSHQWQENTKEYPDYSWLLQYPSVEGNSISVVLHFHILMSSLYYSLHGTRNVVSYHFYHLRPRVTPEEVCEWHWTFLCWRTWTKKGLVLVFPLRVLLVWVTLGLEWSRGLVRWLTLKMGSRFLCKGISALCMKSVMSFLGFSQIQQEVISCTPGDRLAQFFFNWCWISSLYLRSTAS